MNEKNKKDTIQLCSQILAECQKKTLEKNKKYGLSWTKFRMISFKDQILIKILRIINLQEGTTQLVSGESILDNFYELVNYTILARIKLQYSKSNKNKEEFYEALGNNLCDTYDLITTSQLELIKTKNNDYGEAWKDMDIKSLTDMIHVKLDRAHQIINSESNFDEKCDSLNEIYADCCSYGMFSIIKLNEQNQTKKNEN